jgi:hypothetical protein
MVQLHATVVRLADGCWTYHCLCEGPLDAGMVADRGRVGATSSRREVAESMARVHDDLLHRAHDALEPVTPGRGRAMELQARS